MKIYSLLNNLDYKHLTFNSKEDYITYFNKQKEELESLNGGLSNLHFV